MVIKNGLRGYWDFDGNVLDSHTTAANGTATNIDYTTGKRGQATTRATSGGGVVVPSTIFNGVGTGDFTINFWFYGKEPNSGGYPGLMVVANSTSPFPGPTMFFDPLQAGSGGSGLPEFTFRCTQTNQLNITSPSPTTLYDKWTMITFMRSSGVLYVYYDKTLVGSRSDATNINATTLDLSFISGRNTNAAQSLQANIRCDMYGVWNRALSTGEIDFLYNNGTGRDYTLLDMPLPNVNIFAATELTPTKAKLNGEITSLGDEISLDVYFQLRKVGDSSWTNVNIIEVTEVGLISYTAIGLEYETEYEYRIVLLYNNGQDSIISAIQTFSTTEFGKHMTKVSNSGELVLAKIEPLPTGEEGMLVYDSVIKRLKLYNGTEWEEC